VKNVAYDGITCSKITNERGVGEGEVDNFLTEITECKISRPGRKELSEKGFFEAFKSERQKEIERDQGAIIGNGMKSPNEFHCDYKYEKGKGRITVSLSRKDYGYGIVAKIEEWGL